LEKNMKTSSVSNTAKVEELRQVADNKKCFDCGEKGT